MVVVDASALVDALLINGAARERLAFESLQAPDLIDAELLSVLRRLVLAGKLKNGDALRPSPSPINWGCAAMPAAHYGFGPGNCA
jgi:predicted nucleic acid-binding protein